MPVNSRPHILGPQHEAYKIAIENLAYWKDPKIFDNSSASHAAIVLGNIFKNANFSIKMFAGDFNGAVSDNKYYLDSLKSYLDKGNLPITIIFENEPNHYSLALALLNEYPSHSKISVRKIKSGVTLKNNKHFTVADGRMFRLERSSEDYEARCSFNNTAVTGTLDAEFSALYNLSEDFDYKCMDK